MVMENEIRLGDIMDKLTPSDSKRCEYCGSIAEPFYYGVNPEKKEQEPQKETEYTVQKGDNLWEIAWRFYGKGAACYALARRNGIKNPDLIYPGQVLKI